MTSVWHECLHRAVYHAPCGRSRLMMLGESIAQRYLGPGDRLIGIVGEAATGKSSIVAGMFPGLELTNDDRGINVRPAPLIAAFRDGRFSSQTYHVDIRFESAFTQLHEIAEAAVAALSEDRRVVVEHFDELHPVLGLNATLLIGIGAEIIVARPNVFGPYPEEIRAEVEGTAVYRRMAHTAEDITGLILERDLAYEPPDYHSDMSSGFVIEFDERPDDLDIPILEQQVREIIAQGLPVGKIDDDHIKIGEHLIPCTGPRIHVKNTAEIENFRLMKELYFDGLSRRWCIVGLVGDRGSFPGELTNEYPCQPVGET